MKTQRNLVGSMFYFTNTDTVKFFFVTYKKWRLLNFIWNRLTTYVFSSPIINSTEAEHSPKNRTSDAFTLRADIEWGIAGLLVTYPISPAHWPLPFAPPLEAPPDFPCSHSIIKEGFRHWMPDLCCRGVKMTKILRTSLMRQLAFIHRRYSSEQLNQSK